MGLKVWTVHERNGPGETVVVPEGMAWLALAAPMVWLAVYRCWAEAGLVLLAGLIIGFFADLGYLSAGVAVVTGMAVNLIAAFEAADARRRSLARRGWRTAGIVTGHSVPEAERRWFEQAFARTGKGMATSIPAGQAQPPRPEGPATGPRRGAWAGGARTGPGGDVYGLVPGGRV